ncbi:MAG: carbohydrate binding domain-containing protein [Candidatus Omnitrophota bacterium]
MKRIFGAAAIILTLCGPVYGEGNIVPNASFEELKGFDGENPAGWWSWNSDYNGLTAEAKRTGDQSVYISAEANAETHSGILYRYRNVVPGKTYIFSCYVLNSAGNPMTGGSYGQLSIEWLKNEKEIERTWGVTWGPDASMTDWKQVEMTAVAPADADACNFVIQFFRKDGSGGYYADDIMVEEK